MFKTFSNNTACILPVCYHPTTTLLVDDDADFIAQLSQQLAKECPVIAFTNPNDAINYLEKEHQHIFFRERFFKSQNNPDVSTIWEEIYNPNRFNGIMTSVIDYNMPNKTGFDLMKDVQHPVGMSFHSYILLTATPETAFEEDFKQSTTAEKLISKFDYDYYPKLLASIKEKNATNFQWCAYDIARFLSLEPKEKTNFLFEGDFLPILNQHVQTNNLCELYLFDKQGSLLFLDEEANLSWLFVRNDLGVENTIQLARRYNAPNLVIDALSSREFLLALYENEDCKRRQEIEWENYLLPANRLISANNYKDFFNIKSNHNTYYAFTQNLPENGIDKERIVSYKAFKNKF